MIRFENVSKIYPNKVVALRDINLEIQAKEFISIVGPSGAGKSTLVKLLIRQEEPTSGKIIFQGRNLATLRSGEIPYLRRQIGVVFQDFKLLPKKTCFENIAFALEVAGKTSGVIKVAVPEIIKLIGLSGKEDCFPDELSGGEVQRVAIGRALIHEPKVLVADEPTGNLDPVTSQGIVDLLLKINKLGTIVILATHNKDIVDNLGRRVVTLEEGRIVLDQKIGKYKI